MLSPKELNRKRLMAALGDLPPLTHRITSRKIKAEECDAYRLETLLLDLNGIEDVPSYFIMPKSLSGPAPAILFNHSHGGAYDVGKDEVVNSASYMQKPSYAEFLAQMGFCVLCIDSWAFGERRGKTESELFKTMLWNGQVMWGMMVYDSIRAVDYLASRPEVDPEKIGTIGMSMGSTMAWWLAALDTRIKVCIDICCLTDFQSLIETRGVDYHNLYYFVPGLLKHFSTADINALIAPRAHLSLAGMYDVLTPPTGLDHIDSILKNIYREEGASEAWNLIKYKTGHRETAAMRLDIRLFLEKWLANDRQAVPTA